MAEVNVLGTAESLMSLSEFARSVPPKGVHAATPMRWILNGVLVRSTGERIYLDSVQIGGRYFITQAAAKAFFDAQNPGRLAQSAVSQADEAGQALKALGC